MQTLTNGILTIKVKEHGAELASLVKNGVEYLWQADPKFWARHSPVLFPIVGSVWEAKYRESEEDTFIYYRRTLSAAVRIAFIINRHLTIIHDPENTADFSDSHAIISELWYVLNSRNGKIAHILRVNCNSQTLVHTNVP